MCLLWTETRQYALDSQHSCFCEQTSENSSQLLISLLQEKQEEETLITEKKPLYLLVYQDKKMATSYHKIQEMSAECREIESTQRNQNWEKKWLMWKISGEDSGEKCRIYGWFQEISGSIYHPLSLISSQERLLEAELWYKMYKSRDYLLIGCKIGLIFFFMFPPLKNIYWWTWINLIDSKKINKNISVFLNTVNIMVCC